MYSLRRQVHLFLTQTRDERVSTVISGNIRKLAPHWMEEGRDRKSPWLLTILESLTCYDPEGG